MFYVDIFFDIYESFHESKFLLYISPDYQKIYVIIELKKEKLKLQLLEKKIKTSYKEIDDVIFLNKIPLTNIGKPDINHLNKIIKKPEKKNKNY